MLPPAGKQVTLLLFYFNENADLTKYDAPDRLTLLNYWIDNAGKIVMKLMKMTYIF